MHQVDPGTPGFDGIYEIWEYIDQRKRGVLTDWTLDNQQRAKLDDKIRMLGTAGAELPPKLLASLGDGLFKFCVRGTVQLRPILCDGPIEVGREFTFLVQGEERDDRLDLESLKQKARERRQLILNNPQATRRRYE